MDRRFVQVLMVGLVLSVMTALVPAHAQTGSPHVPAISVNWSIGPSSPFSGARFDGALVNGRVYFLGFRTLGDATDGSVWYYDVATQTYVDTGVDMKNPVSNYGIAVLRDSAGLGLYIFGGRDAAAQIVTTTQVYYPQVNQSKIVTTDPWPGTTPAACVSLPAMGTATAGNKAFVLGGMSFAANGCVDAQSSQTWIYDPMAAAGSRWTQGANLHHARGYITPAVLGNRIYAIGGDTISAGLLTAQPFVEALQVTGGGWSDAPADLPQPCDESQAFGLTRGPGTPAIVLAGCGQWPNALPSTFVYDQTANTWTQSADIKANRRNHAGDGISFNGQPRLYILGGYGEASSFIDPIDVSELGKLGPFSGAAPHGRGSVGQGSAYATTS